MGWERMVKKDIGTARGAEMRKARPCVIFSQSALNRMLLTVLAETIKL